MLSSSLAFDATWVSSSSSSSSSTSWIPPPPALADVGVHQDASLSLPSACCAFSLATLIPVRVPRPISAPYTSLLGFRWQTRACRIFLCWCPIRPGAQCVRNSSAPSAVTQTCPQSPRLISGYDTTIGFVAQPRNLQSLSLLHPKSSLPPIHAPHLCKNELSKLQIYHFTLPYPYPCPPPSIPSPFFFQTFKSFSGSPAPQGEISKFLGCSELCFLPDSIKFLDFSLISGIG